MSQPVVSRIERAVLRSLSLEDAIILGDAVGLEIAARAYPCRGPTRDAAHARKLLGFLQHVHAPPRYGLEVPLPNIEGLPERRAWDAMIFGGDGATGVELEMRLYDLQGQMRRTMVKWRDSNVERLLLLIADTRTNRHVMRELPGYVDSLPRLRTANVLGQLELGERPKSGYLLA